MTVGAATLQPDVARRDIPQRDRTQRDGPSGLGGRWAGAALLALTAFALIPVAVAVPLPLLGAALVAFGLVALACAHPPAAAYILLTATPLIAGLERSAYIPLLRPHEALAVVLAAGVGLRALIQLSRGGLPLRLRRVDVVLILMALASSLLPLVWMAARSITPTVEDLFYAATMWKFYGIFVLVRASVRTERQVARCLYLSISAGMVVAVIAILQSLKVPVVLGLVSLIYETADPNAAGAGRGSSTLGSPIAVGDVMAYSLVICLALLRVHRARWFLIPAAGLFCLGALGSGQFSGVIALVVSVAVAVIVTGQVRRLLLVLGPAMLVAAAALQPILQGRLNDIDSTGVPQSWYIRWVNLHDFIWPELMTGWNWLFGVRPTPVIRIDAVWGPYIYIESGHTWLLWIGGVPFLLAYLLFTWVAIRTVIPVFRLRRDAVGAAAIASLASLVTAFVLMSFDPHITMRGTADLMFSLLALATAVPALARSPHRPNAVISERNSGERHIRCTPT
ncbi:MAG TPA: hypothetical protein VK453_20630 [Micromonosporaceae bacterium]|nr:hypothetical protein [Micromonosporaceae bacterium]